MEMVWHKQVHRFHLDIVAHLPTNIELPLLNEEIEFHPDGHSVSDWLQQNTNWNIDEMYVLFSLIIIQLSIHYIRSTGNWT